MNMRLTITMAALAMLVLPSISAAEKPFPKTIPTLTGNYPEGFAIGKGTTAYNGAPFGSIYKFDLRSGEGEVLVPPVQNPDLDSTCVLLGMRVDPRTNYLFAAGCFNGNAFVYDADSGALIMEYQLVEPFGGVINDLTITKKAVYFTDSFRPVLYRLPLSKNGQIPLDPGAVTEIPLPEEFELDPETEPCCGGNGIVSTPNGKTLIVGHSNLQRLYRLDVATGDVALITEGLPIFPDGLAIKGRTVYSLHPLTGFTGEPDEVTVTRLSSDLLTGTIVGTITDSDMDGIASGAVFGSSLYVNNARYTSFPEPDTEYWVTKLSIRTTK